MGKTIDNGSKEKRIYRIVLPNADNELKKRCLAAAVEKYGEMLPEVVMERLSVELNAVKENGYASHYLIGSMMAEKSKENGYRAITRGLLGSAFMAYLCGISVVNPLPAHYWCPDCHYFELADADHRTMGYDLPGKKCPQCGAGMRGEGANIEPEILMGIKLDREPDIILNVASEIRPVLIEYIKGVFGEDCVYRAGVKVFLDDGSIRRNVHPGGVFIVPTDVDISEITGLRDEIPEDDFCLKVTEEDCHKIDGVLKKYDILTLPELGMLKKLEDKTGFHSDDIGTNDEEVMSVFQREAFSFLPGHKRDTGESITDKAVRISRPRCFSELVKLTAMMHGVGTWKDNGEQLIQSGKSLRECIACRDDIMQDLISTGMVRKRAYEIMDRVRKGKGVTDEMSWDMHLSGVSDWYINSCTKITYLYPKAHAADYMLLYWKLAYYKLHYPDEYRQVLFEAEEESALHLDN